MPANAYLTSAGSGPASLGVREDLVDMIWNTAPSDTPLISSIEKVSAESVNHEWQRDVLATPVANNAVAEGADASYTAVTPPERWGNQTQIARKTFSISDTMEAVKKAGRKSEIRYQTVKQGKELRKDMEASMIENPTLTTGATRVARGLRGWLNSNDVRATGASPNPSTNTGPTDGTLRNFTESLLREAVVKAYSNGGNPSMLMVAPTLKQAISTNWTGNGTKFIKGEDRKLQAAYDFYSSDFGDFKIVPNRVMGRSGGRTREAYLLDDSMVAIAVLRDMETQELARIGSARNYMIECEFTMEMREERAHSCVRDVQAY
jgi:hypothetical protein